MKNNQILRSPDVSINSVTLKSDDINAEVSMKTNRDSLNNRATENSADFNDNIEEVVTLDEIDLKSMSDNLIKKEKEIISDREQLKKSLDQLEEKEKSYKESIYEELKEQLTEEIKLSYDEREEQLNQLINSITDKLKSNLEDFEDEIISIVFESVCKVIGQQIIKSEAVISTVHEVMKYSQDRMEMIIRVSDKDYELINNSRDELMAGVSNRISIVSDDLVRYGGCIIETTAGRIDGRLEQQLGSLLELLLNERN